MVSLSLDPPRHGRRSSGGGGSLKTKLLVVLVIFGAGAGAGFWAGRWSARVGLLGEGREAAVAAAPAADAASAGSAATPAGAAQVAAPAAGAAPAAVPAPGSVTAPGTAPGAEPAPAAAQASAPAQTGMRRASVIVSGALEDGIAKALSAEDRAQAQQLTQVVNRLLVWHLNIARDGRRGDRIEVLWEPAPRIEGMFGVTASKEPIVHAVRYASQKLGKEIAAYRFQAPGSAWARYYQPDGTELEERLVDGPIADYEQVTSLLRDGRKHAGVDFKTPVGTDVVSPFNGRIVKRNWNFRYNGNCLDIVDPATGRHAIFLHLDVLPKDMTVGRTVKKGEKIASSGNSGRSYAPHLHYQLEDSSGRVLDPYAIHQTKRLSLSPEHKAAFEAARAKLDPIIATASATR
jgi:murein DD-endopeptidase MepM/ murein hydrolase activator NlpD